MADDRLYFRQLLAGRDFAVGDQFATQMVNFAYAIGDRSTGECVLVDPAWCVSDLIDVVAEDAMTVTGVLASHYHADHVGGSIMGHQIEGVAALLGHVSCPIHVQAEEVPWMERTAGVSGTDLVAHAAEERVQLVRAVQRQRSYGIGKIKQNMRVSHRTSTSL
jgi:glyoxylase-like metal-dependent hydrolase (beta-lactamase superfamily II)